MWEWLIFSAMAVVGAAFVAVPLLAARRTRLAGAAVAIAVVAAGLGLYAKLGHPQLAARAFETPNPEDLPALTSRLVTAVHENPDNLQAWLWLGQLYFALGAKEEAAKALGEAVRLARARRLGATQLAAILSQYGIALSQASGTVTPIAEQALRESIAADPKDQAARFYLGIAAVQRGDHAAAERLWRGLLADMEPDAPNRRMVIDQLAALEARRGNAPDIGAMVEGLAARLEANPGDLEGWRRLIRSYAVLGDREKAKAALGKARAHFKSDARAITALNETARENKIE
jgi:cytochrome c-type biogenesis protein CcmH